MGKEQELLEAARTGNRLAVERLVSGKRLSGAAPGGTTIGGVGNTGGTASNHPLSSLLSIWRSPNVNCVDSSGYTPLHHASLNGHRDVVEVLLRNEAVTNIADHKGCFPLHLAAWKGDVNIVQLLIHHGPSHAKVNEQNNDHETALHCAAQYGHTEVVRVLLEELTDPTMRNKRLETPLDLAALYGRLEVVKLLLNAHPNLLNCHIRKHTPLHLAARNGHRKVVRVLLDFSLDINYQTENGSALHEAALFGKTDVVLMLLDAGIDVNITDNKGMTALDIVQELPSQTSTQIAALIQAHGTVRKVDEELGKVPVMFTPASHNLEIPDGDIPGSLLNLQLDFEIIPQAESPYEALYNASSNHSPNSICSEHLSDRGSFSHVIGAHGNEQPTPLAKPPPKEEEELGNRTVTDICQELNKTQNEDENPYELLFTAESKRPDGRGDLHLQGISQIRPRQPVPSQDLIKLSNHWDSSDLSSGHSEGESHGSERRNSEQRRSSSGGWSLASADSCDSHTQQHFSGLLHGSSPVCETKDPSLSCEPTSIEACRNVAANLMELSLRRSLSKSDSDLLTCSPPSGPNEEDWSRSESFTNCSSVGGKKRLEKSPSFTSEWDEIDKIMTSIGQGIEFSQEQQITAGSCFPEQSVSHWLRSIGLVQYESKLVLNGFDDVRFLTGAMMDDQDLIDIGITDIQHRRQLLQAAQSLPKPSPLSGDNCVSAWLSALALHQYAPSFLGSGYTSMETLQNLWELEIVNVLKVHLLGHRKRLLASLAERPCEEPPRKPPRFSQTQEEHRLSLRPPNVTTSYASLQNWHHQPEKLILESCSYEACYLGSMLIKDLRGTESTQDASAKMRKSTEQMKKIPRITLSISYKGVKFIDASNQNIIAEHEIRNISCAAQDPEDLCTFAYITKDLQTSHHYCHVFSTSDVNQAYEIILTLGQAFEVAYQLALQAQKPRHPEATAIRPCKPVPKPRGSIQRQTVDSLEKEHVTPTCGGVSWTVDHK
ncbi:hypothetical protein GDO86_003351 [Hymenochirus boettgeri]|uniref:Ankyrin repeat and sterile alpha motif domain containing 1A n=1 Tax=Hymenochirus boettgeri TaxID=247094 RepID=A0A8T2K943_9PIPI|nr:hypothetical protein GDO86_003351 [Hymenochirus boettgeri]